MRYRPPHLHSFGTITTSWFVLVPAKANNAIYRQLKLTSNGAVPAISRTWDNVGRVGCVAFPCFTEESSNTNPPSSSSSNKPTKTKRKTPTTRKRTKSSLRSCILMLFNVILVFTVHLNDFKMLFNSYC